MANARERRPPLSVTVLRDRVLLAACVVLYLIAGLSACRSPMPSEPSSDRGPPGPSDATDRPRTSGGDEAPELTIADRVGVTYDGQPDLELQKAVRGFFDWADVLASLRLPAQGRTSRAVLLLRGPGGEDAARVAMVAWPDGDERPYSMRFRVVRFSAWPSPVLGALDMDGDRHPEVVVRMGGVSYAWTAVIDFSKPVGDEVVFTDQDQPKAWRVAFCDIDGDGLSELVRPVRASSLALRPYDPPQPSPGSDRLFMVYRWTGATFSLDRIAQQDPCESRRSVPDGTSSGGAACRDTTGAGELR